MSLLPGQGRAGPEVLLQRVSEDKAGKNRLHLDLRTKDLDSEVARVLALGAAVITHAPVREGGWIWHILADPEGPGVAVSGYRMVVSGVRDRSGARSPTRAEPPRPQRRGPSESTLRLGVRRTGARASATP